MAANEQALLYQIALTKIPKIGPILTKSLISYCGGVEPIFSTSKSTLQRIPGIGRKIAESITGQRVMQAAEAELAFIKKHQIRSFFYLDKTYPYRLKRYKDAPLLLYYKGNSDLNHSRIIATVGTRKPTQYGLQILEQFLNAWKPYNPLIISGLAYGIDIAAHRLALKLDLETIGVLGSGLDMLYPAVHRKTAKAMINRGGLLTEYASGTKPNRENFPMRNRIIAGLCDALVVIESKHRGGSMITAEMANYYNKDVFAVPGRIGDEHSEGCNFLVKTNRAQILQHPEDLVSAMQWKQQLSREKQRALFIELTTDEDAIYQMLHHQTPVSIDKLYKELDFSSSQLAALLLNLEFKGLVRALPGKQYMRV